MIFGEGDEDGNWEGARMGLLGGWQCFYFWPGCWLHGVTVNVFTCFEHFSVCGESLKKV